jgi:hypothetical protein
MTWHNIFRRVHRNEIINFLESESFQRGIHSTKVKGDNIIDILWKANSPERWRVEKICGIKSAERSNIDELFLQLVVNKIIVLDYSRSVLSWSFGHTVDVNNNREQMLTYTLDSN